MTDRYAVIGNPIAQSKSPLIHGQFAATHGQDMVYEAIEGPLEGFADAVRAFIAAGGRGMNVTAPFKLQAYEMADTLSERARQAGAVNTLKFEGGRIAADNFDGIGLVNDLQRNLGMALSGCRVLMLGAGGAARGALRPLLEQGPAELVIANRHPEKAEALARPYAASHGVRGISYAEIGRQRFDLVVNATSASLRGELPPVPATAFSPEGLAYELAYGKGLTPFLRLAQNAGVSHLADGVGMLIEQAAEGFAWWRGVRPETGPVIRRMTVPLV
ncbi:Shikimate dehydrogenase (NADP(+)) [Rubrivivax sp. A210]|uniref:shikimate dehydrogenase n=1 Tax=Rubrivivax sp. A210 TaxID=2772301 RepID=UPI00191991A4|nr:shikimate dehydrogenase [Rubrivivax sp. A210]CAD5375150.1 Shikimate dehydrogenase (NADP(+)) [Rubrivivax sp. A210]